jgi:CRP-like cAMP-binding protein
VPERAVTQVERVLALKTFEVFKGLPAQELAVLAEHARPRFFPSGALLLRPGIPVKTLHFILQGLVEVVREGSAPAELGPQDVLGGLRALGGDDQTEHARALQNTTTLQLHRDDLQDVFEDNFSVFLGVLRTLARAQLSLRRRLGEHAGFSPSAPGTAAHAVGELGLVEKLFHLRKAMDFAESRVEALADLAQEAEAVRVEAGQVLWEVGDLAEYNVLVLEGVIGATTTSSEQHFEFGPGSVVGGLDAMAGEPRWYRAVAKEPLTALYMRSQHVLDVIEDNVEFGMDMLRLFARTLHGLSGRLSEPPNDQALL